MRFIFILIVSLAFTACRSFVTVQKSEKAINNMADIDTVICISPEVVFFEGSLGSAIDYRKNMEERSYYLTHLNKYGNKASKFKFKIYHPSFTPDLDADYYNLLLPLKAEIIETLFERNNKINSQAFSYLGKSVQKTVFADVPQISPDFASLSKKYGTPYFSWYGVMSSNNLSILAFAIVNVETMELVVKEIIYVGRPLNKRNSPPLLYDSFSYIK